MKYAPIVLAIATVGIASCSGGMTPPASSPGVQAASAASAPLMSVAASKPVYVTAQGACSITSCSNATLTYNGKKVATMGYLIAIAYFQNTPFAGTFMYNKGVYPDFIGTFSSGGTAVLGGVSYQVWNVVGKYARGTGSATQRFYVRGHSGRGGGNTIINVSGTATAPSTTPKPSPTPSPAPVPTDS